MLIQNYIINHVSNVYIHTHTLGDVKKPSPFKHTTWIPDSGFSGSESTKGSGAVEINHDLLGFTTKINSNTSRESTKKTSAKYRALFSGGLWNRSVWNTCCKLDGFFGSSMHVTGRTDLLATLYAPCRFLPGGAHGRNKNGLDSCASVESLKIKRSNANRHHVSLRFPCWR